MDDLLSFQPKGLFEIPMYRENLSGVSDRFMFLLIEELRGGIGPAMLNAKDMLMFILPFGELIQPLYTVHCWLRTTSELTTLLTR